MRILFYLLSRLPLRVLQAMGAAAGELLWLLHSGRRQTALRNVERCFPELDRAEQTRLARSAIGHEMKTYFETPLVWLGPEARAKSLVREYRGIEALDAAVAQGKGVLLLT